MKRKDNVMVDIETLGTNPGDVILSVGAVQFDEDGLGEEFYLVLDLQTSLDAQFSVTADTLHWWMSDKVSNEAREEVFGPKAPADVTRGLQSFANWMMTLESKTERGCNLWGNGASFDNALLTKAMTMLGISIPWKFWNDRCYRTLKSIHVEVPYPKREGVYHNALDDAKHQARHLMGIVEVTGNKSILD